ncbi:IS701 family transposase [Nonomuraea sp. NPDC046570]|uniref:IS701 family transposase n=1 Tax=Nonomuraea sp. NPDC046570 TaxID=3155255 RepID=UPI0033F20BF0
MADTVDADGWMVTFNDLMGRVAGRFGRIEPRRTATAYVRGLLSDLERKNCWNLAEHAGLTGPQAMQRLLRTACWDADAVRDDVRGYVIEQLGQDGVLIVDETGFLKKGVGSAGVQRQYTGTAGRIENSQVGVFLAYTTARGRALVDRRLYLPEHSWLADAARCVKAGVPDQTAFATKPVLAAEMIAGALDAGLSARWVSGDEVYGSRPAPAWPAGATPDRLRAGDRGQPAGEPGRDRPQRGRYRRRRGRSALAPLPRRSGRQGPALVRLGLGARRRSRA